MAVLIGPAFMLINTGVPANFTLPVVLIFGIAMSPASGVTGSLFSMVFSGEVRYTGASVGYTISQVCGSAFAPTIATALFAATQSSDAIVIYLLIVSAISTISVALLPGGWGRKEAARQNGEDSDTNRTANDSVGAEASRIGRTGDTSPRPSRRSISSHASATVALMETPDISFRTRKWVRPEDLNANGTLFGGSLLKWIDEEAAIYAIIELGNGRPVTKYISEINFVSSAVQGDLIDMGLTATKFGRTSLTMRAEVRNMITRQSILTIEEIVRVNLDTEGKPEPHGYDKITYDRDRIPTDHLRELQ